jgi:DNA-binding NtrC family response regulator
VIFDETLELIERARTVFNRAEVGLTFATSLPELELTIKRFGPHDLMILNMSHELSGWAMAEHLRRLPTQGRIIGLMDAADDPRSAYLEQAANVQCVTRPSDPAALEHLLRQLAFESPLVPAAEAPVPISGDVPSFHGIVGGSRPMTQIFSLIEKVAPGDANVCIYGESGTGKELVARAMHEASPRAQAPLITLDCTAIPEGLMESQLFGHVKGAFTGAVDNRDGVFSLAHNGTLFMDELCELNLPLQAKLLRVVQSREFSKVGSSRAISTNIRLITATNKDLKHAVEAGAFREDLYYRVAVVMIKVPPLRERRDDIPGLVQYFLQKYAKAYRKPIHGIAPGAMDRIVSSSWPGNVRQLQNFIEQAVVLTDAEILRERDLFVTDHPAPRVPSGGGGGLDIDLGLPLREVEKRYILRTLNSVHGSRTRAAKVLGISLRALQYKLKAYMDEDGLGGSGTGGSGTGSPARLLPGGPHHPAAVAAVRRAHAGAPRLSSMDQR